MRKALPFRETLICLADLDAASNLNELAALFRFEASFCGAPALEQALRLRCLTHPCSICLANGVICGEGPKWACEGRRGKDDYPPVWSLERLVALLSGALLIGIDNPFEGHEQAVSSGNLGAAAQDLLPFIYYSNHAV